MSTDEASRRLRGQRVHRPPRLRVPPRARAGSWPPARRRARPGGDGQRPGHRDRGLRGRRRRARRRVADGSSSRARRSSATWSARSRSTATRPCRPRSPGGLPLHGHERRAELDDRVRGAVRPAFAEAGLLPRAGHRADVHDGRDRGERRARARRLDTLDILVLWKGFPTTASTQTIFTTLAPRTTSTSRGQGLQAVGPERELSTCNVPGMHTGRPRRSPGAAPAHPVWFKRDPRVGRPAARSAASRDQDLMAGVGGRGRCARRSAASARPGGAGAPRSGGMAAATQGGMPPRENQRHELVARLRARLGPARLGRTSSSAAPRTTSRRASCRPSPPTTSSSGTRAASARVGLPGLRPPRTARAIARISGSSRRRSSPASDGSGCRPNPSGRHPSLPRRSTCTSRHFPTHAPSTPGSPAIRDEAVALTNAELRARGAAGRRRAR